MRQQKYCNPKDMIQFLLALCRQGDSSTTPASRDDALDRCFEECFEKVTPVAELDEVRQKLGI